MEIHAPEKPILTVKEAIVHLAIVTVGILIALSLEGLVEYVHHRTVVREAREIMQTEIEGNYNDLNQTMDRIMQQQDAMRKGIKVFSALPKTVKPNIESEPFFKTMLSYRTANPRSAGHSAAELMGAFGYMDYLEVRRYATIYDAQDRFLREQTEALAEGIKAVAWFQERDFAASTPAERAVFVDQLRASLAGLIATGQFGTLLEKEYAEFLATVRVKKPGAIDGEWHGTLEHGRRPIVVHITAFEDGMAVTVDSPTQGATGEPASSVSLDGAQFKFEMNIAPVKFAGSVDDSKSTITGTWTEGDAPQPLVLTRKK